MVRQGPLQKKIWTCLLLELFLFLVSSEQIFLYTFSVLQITCRVGNCVPVSATPSLPETWFSGGFRVVFGDELKGVFQAGVRQDSPSRGDTNWLSTRLSLLVDKR